MERGNDLLLLVYHGGNIRQLHDDSKTASLYYIVTYELFCQVPASGTNVKGPFWSFRVSAVGSNKWNFVQKKNKVQRFLVQIITQILKNLVRISNIWIFSCGKIIKTLQNWFGLIPHIQKQSKCKGGSTFSNSDLCHFKVFLVQLQKEMLSLRNLIFLSS